MAVDGSCGIPGRHPSIAKKPHDDRRLRRESWRSTRWAKTTSKPSSRLAALRRAMTASAAVRLAGVVATGAVLACGPADAADLKAKVVKAAIIMAHTLGLKITAEGVENEAQIEFLKIFECDEAQGYHFGRPMPAEDFASLLESAPHSFRES